MLISRPFQSETVANMRGSGGKAGLGIAASPTNRQLSKRDWSSSIVRTKSAVTSPGSLKTPLA
eukprot:8979873-Alexandrium_andersonii.AAC.1